MTKSVRSALPRRAHDGAPRRDRLSHSRGTRLVNGNALVARLAVNAFQRGIPLWLSSPIVELVYRRRPRHWGGRGSSSTDIGETAWVQIKSKTSQAELNDYLGPLSTDGSCHASSSSATALQRAQPAHRAAPAPVDPEHLSDAADRGRSIDWLTNRRVNG